LVDLFTKYKDVFVTKSSKYRQTNRVYHHINNAEAQPILQSLRRLLLTGKAGRSGQDA
jgi:hypothetical protein